MLVLSPTILENVPCVIVKNVYSGCFVFFFWLHSLYFSHIKLCGGYSQSLGPLHRDSGVGLDKMVSEFLIRRLGGHRLFPEIRGEITVGLGNGIKSSLGENARVMVQPLAEM